MTATYIVGDVRDTLAAMPDGSVDLILTSPPFLALRSYLPADHPDKHREIGSEPGPAEFLDTLLALSAEWRRVLAPHGSMAVELGDTYSGSGGGGGDYLPGGMKDGQQQFAGSAASMRESNAAHWRQKNSNPDGWPQAKSLALIPELYRIGLAYGINPLTGNASPAGRWKVRNVVRWCRPNPPVGALGDKFRPGTSDMVIACTSGKRWFDLDAVRFPADPANKRPSALVREGIGGRTDQVCNPVGEDGQRVISNPAGAPPLDWWQVSTEPSTSLRVPCGPRDGARRTTSPDCPVHGDQADPAPTAPRGERAGSQETRTPSTDDHHAQGQLDGCAPTDPRSGRSTEVSTSETPRQPDAPSATPRSTASRRTDPAPATSPADTPSARTPPRTGDTSAEPESSGSGSDTPESSRAEACPPADVPETASDSGGIPDPSQACRCSYYVDVDIKPTSHYAGWPTDSWEISTEAYRNSHYATWPRKLLTRPILAMCPLKVCTVCGEPSRRIVENPNAGHGANAWNRHGTAAAEFHKDVDRPHHHESVTLGWTDCGHDSWRNGIVLDPFAGSGTTLAVATGHGRDAIGIDIDSRNVDLARDRVGPMFFQDTTLAQYEEIPA